jgi:hypothetical protein
MILTAIGGFLGAAAFAATRSDSAGGLGASHPLQPHLVEYPDRVTTVATARFDSVQPGRPPARAKPGNPLGLECRLDGGDWESCRPPVSFTDLDLGTHSFELRAVNAAGRSGPAARFVWRLRRHSVEQSLPLPPSAESQPASAESQPAPPTAESPAPPPATEEGEPFAIEQVALPGDLYPGEPAQPLALRVTNPNPVPIEVTSLTFSFAVDPPGCPTAENFIVVPSGASAATPLRIAAETSLELPQQGITPPLIAMRELPVNQNACQGATLELSLEGEAQEGEAQR